MWILHFLPPMVNSISHALPPPMLTCTPNVNQIFSKKDRDRSVSRMYSKILFHIILFWCTSRIISEQ